MKQLMPTFLAIDVTVGARVLAIDVTVGARCFNYWYYN